MVPPIAERQPRPLQCRGSGNSKGFRRSVNDDNDKNATERQRAPRPGCVCSETQLTSAELTMAVSFLSLGGMGQLEGTLEVIGGATGTLALWGTLPHRAAT